MKFIKLTQHIEKYVNNPDLVRTKEGAVELFCSDCDFYKESDKDLECGSFKLLRLLVDKNVLTMKQISDVVKK
jgi:hypothetical protein